MLFIEKIAHAFRDHHLPYALVGGYAVAFHGAARGTVDIDLVIRIREKDFLTAEQALLSIGLQSKLPVTGGDVFKFRREYIEKRNLIAWSFYNPKHPLEVVDIIITEDLEEMKVKKFSMGTTSISVASIDDLIQMKTRSGRLQDLNDVAALKIIRDGGPK